MSRRKAGTALLVALVLAAGMLIIASPAHACLCQRTSLAEVGDQTDVFVATAGASETGPGGPRRTPVSVGDVYQGDLPAEVTLSSSIGFSCGYPLAPGVSYLVVGAVGGREQLYLTACSGTRVATPDTRERAARVFGPPTTPLPDPVLAVQTLFTSLLGP